MIFKYINICWTLNVFNDATFLFFMFNFQLYVEAMLCLPGSVTTRLRNCPDVSSEILSLLPKRWLQNVFLRLQMLKQSLEHWSLAQAGTLSSSHLIPDVKVNTYTCNLNIWHDCRNVDIIRYDTNKFEPRRGLQKCLMSPFYSGDKQPNLQLQFWLNWK